MRSSGSGRHVAHVSRHVPKPCREVTFRRSLVSLSFSRLRLPTRNRLSTKCQTTLPFWASVAVWDVSAAAARGGESHGVRWREWRRHCRPKTPCAYWRGTRVAEGTAVEPRGGAPRASLMGVFVGCRLPRRVCSTTGQQPRWRPSHPDPLWRRVPRPLGRRGVLGEQEGGTRRGRHPLTNNPTRARLSLSQVGIRAPSVPCGASRGWR